MVKLSKAMTAESRENIRRIRARFIQARERGYSHMEASAIASTDDPIVDRRTTASPLQSPQEEVPAEPTSRIVRLSGSSAKEADKSTRRSKQRTTDDNGHTVSKTDELRIPPNWEDLPWPQLKVIAERICGSQVRNRAQANEIIGQVV
jgi:hypothetical protein